MSSIKSVRLISAYTIISSAGQQTDMQTAKEIP